MLECFKAIAVYKKQIQNNHHSSKYLKNASTKEQQIQVFTKQQRQETALSTQKQPKMFS
jgi:hypothetical protein